MGGAIARHRVSNAFERTKLMDSPLRVSDFLDCGTPPSRSRDVSDSLSPPSREKAIGSLSPEGASSCAATLFVTDDITDVVTDVTGVQASAPKSKKAKRIWKTINTIRPSWEGQCPAGKGRNGYAGPVCVVLCLQPEKHLRVLTRWQAQVEHAYRPAMAEHLLSQVFDESGCLRSSIHLSDGENMVENIMSTLLVEQATEMWYPFSLNIRLMPYYKEFDSDDELYLLG